MAVSAFLASHPEASRQLKNEFPHVVVPIHRVRLERREDLEDWIIMRINPSRISTSPSWRKSVVLMKSRLLRNRWATLAGKLEQDPSVTPRLLDQSLACLCAYKGRNYDHERALA